MLTPTYTFTHSKTQKRDLIADLQFDARLVLLLTALRKNMGNERKIQFQVDAILMGTFITNSTIEKIILKYWPPPIQNKKDLYDIL